MDRLSELVGHHVQFSYTAVDRIVLNGYLDRLQRPENLVYFFHEVARVACIEPAVLASRTEPYRAWVRQHTADHQIPVLPAPKGARKEELVLPHYRRLRETEGVACVLTSMEQSRTFVSYTPRFAPPRPAVMPTIGSSSPATSGSYTTVSNGEKMALPHFSGTKPMGERSMPSTHRCSHLLPPSGTREANARLAWTMQPPTPTKSGRVQGRR